MDEVLKAQLKVKLKAAFASSSARVVSLQDLERQFDETSRSKLGPFERLAVRSKVSSLIDNVDRMDDVIRETGPDGKVGLFVTSKFIEKNLASAIDKGQVPGMMADAVIRAAEAASEAIQKSPDHAARLASKDTAAAPMTVASAEAPATAKPFKP